jgi:mRNA-degrading endonuclease toxin of MazEF toxin-antitoxin module
MAMARRNDVVLARVSYSDSQGVKTRPCIVLSNESYNASGYVLIAPMTTSKDEYCLPIDEDEAGCRLVSGTCARFDTVFRIHSSQIERKIGRVKNEFYWRMVGRLRELIE